MKSLCKIAGPMLVVLLAGCGDPKSPKLAISTEPSAKASRESSLLAPEIIPVKRKIANRTQPSSRLYHGRTVEAWGRLLMETKDREMLQEGCRILHVLGAEGRPYLIQGLESQNPETRRMCLQHLTPADLKSQGEQGRMLLIKLAGDTTDLRIRERATSYLVQWARAVPGTR